MTVNNYGKYLGKTLVHDNEPYVVYWIEAKDDPLVCLRKVTDNKTSLIIEWESFKELIDENIRKGTLNGTK